MRRPNIIRPVKLHISLPEDVLARVTLFLYSEVEGRVPKGAYAKFFLERIQDYFNRGSPDDQS